MPQYWIVDSEARLVERWRPDDARPEILFKELPWAPLAGVDPLLIDLMDLFYQVHGAT